MSMDQVTKMAQAVWGRRLEESPKDCGEQATHENGQQSNRFLITYGSCHITSYNSHG